MRSKINNNRVGLGRMVVSSSHYKAIHNKKHKDPHFQGPVIKYDIDKNSLCEICGEFGANGKIHTTKVCWHKECKDKVA